LFFSKCHGEDQPDLKPSSKPVQSADFIRIEHPAIQTAMFDD
jgi:hypothetical protein